MDPRRLAAVVIAVLVGCDPGGADAPDADPAAPDAAADDGAPFDPVHVLAVELELAAADWDLIRYQTRTIPSLFSTCGTGPFPDPPRSSCRSWSA